MDELLKDPLIRHPCMISDFLTGSINYLAAFVTYAVGGLKFSTLTPFSVSRMRISSHLDPENSLGNDKFLPPFLKPTVYVTESIAGECLKRCVNQVGNVIGVLRDQGFLHFGFRGFLRHRLHGFPNLSKATFQPKTLRVPRIHRGNSR